MAMSKNWHEYFTCDADSGILIWRHRPRSMFNSDHAFNRWNKRYAGQVAGNNDDHSVRVRIGKRSHGAHIIIWEMVHGPIPERIQIDHIDGDPWNNRLSNLRLATHAQNQANKAVTRRSKSGLKGVSWNDKRRLWQSCMSRNGTSFTIGWYKTKGLAAVAYAKAALRYQGKFARFT